jgi:hypothetical protein
MLLHYDKHYPITMTKELAITYSSTHYRYQYQYQYQHHYHYHYLQLHYCIQYGSPCLRLIVRQIQNIR